MSEIVLSDDARRILWRWTADDFYIRISPFTSTWLYPTKPHKIRWSVSVEFRGLPYQSWMDSGRDLDSIIISLGEKIPRRRIMQPGYKPATKRGKNNQNYDSPTAPLGKKDAVTRVKLSRKKSKK